MNNLLSISLLALEAQEVVKLRLAKLALGGRAALDEAQLMVSEKADASLEAAETLMTGGSIDTVITRYRQHVAANASRLGANGASRA